MINMKVIRYSEALKLQVVSELESGKFRSQQEAREAYGITGGSTIHHWLKKYGKYHLLARVVSVLSGRAGDKKRQELQKTGVVNGCQVGKNASNREPQSKRSLKYRTHSAVATSDAQNLLCNC